MARLATSERSVTARDAIPSFRYQLSPPDKGRPELSVHVDHPNAAMLGTTVQSVASPKRSYRTLFVGGLACVTLVVLVGYLLLG